MITSCKYTKGYPTKLKGLKGTFKFSKGITILFGPNGCGKTTLLETLGAYSGVVNGGWTKVHPPLSFHGSISSSKFPECYGNLVRNKYEAEVVWDGTPTFLFNAANSDKVNMSYFVDNEGQSDDGITSFDEQVSSIVNKISQGEHRISKLSKVFNMLKNPPVLNETKDKYANNVWVESRERQINYIKSLPKTGPVTVLFDEPDKALSITNQIAFWFLCVDHLKDYQVIIATHSMLIPFLPYPVTIIDIEPGYYIDCKRQLGNIMKPTKNKEL